jgi:hypothetical protein
MIDCGSGRPEDRDFPHVPERSEDAERVAHLLEAALAILRSTRLAPSIASLSAVVAISWT